MTPLQIFFAFSLLILSSGCASQNTLKDSCQTNSAAQKLASHELQQIASADQLDRHNLPNTLDVQSMRNRDTLRRKRVMELSQEGCLKTSSDYDSAAQIFMNGFSEEDYWHAYRLENEAYRLDHNSKLWIAAIAIDLFLTHRHQNQLFGTQLSPIPGDSGKYCVVPIEPGFPESLRIKYLKMTLQQSAQDTLKGLNPSQANEEVPFCDLKLKATKQGSVPGLW